MFSEASTCTDSSSTSTWPSATSCPSRTRMASTMPPSRCWTVLRSLSTLILPGATTAPLISPQKAQAPSTPKEEQDHCHPLAYDAAGIFYGAVFPAAGGLIFTVAAAGLAGRDFYRGDAGDGAPCGLQGRILFGGRIRHCRQPPAFFAGLPAVSAMPAAGGLSFPAACGPERPVPAGGAWRQAFPARPGGGRKGLSVLPA